MFGTKGAVARDGSRIAREASWSAARTRVEVASQTSQTSRMALATTSILDSWPFEVRIPGMLLKADAVAAFVIISVVEIRSPPPSIISRWLAAAWQILQRVIEEGTLYLKR